MRPGTALGDWPERVLARQGALERGLRYVGGAWQQASPRRLRGARAIARSVASHERALQGLSRERYQAALAELRETFARRPLERELIARAFAFARVSARRTLGMAHYDEQLLAGWLMWCGKVVEMDTGEGKTLAATLPAASAALGGVPVHVVTVNDYLARRDAEQMGPVYAALGLRVGCVVADMSAVERRAAYACDVTYCTAKQLVFDYLRDRLAARGQPSRLRLALEMLYAEKPRAAAVVQRGLCYAIVDEADSVLIDEARTPLVISGAGQPVHAPDVPVSAIGLASALVRDEHFRVDAGQRSVELTAAGRARLGELAARESPWWRVQRRREAAARQALHALHLLQRDRHYLVKDSRVQIIDENTGRVLPDRAWERGLHQMVEVRESLPQSAESRPLARISYQRFFTRYLRLAGMTGTAREVAGELWTTYQLGLARVPTHRACHRRRYRARTFADQASKWRALVDRVAEIHAQGRPLLIGTRTVTDSEHLSGLLDAEGIRHRVLNARQDAGEAATVADAGQPGRVTVATNMAGRGTDIALGEGIEALGGLHVIVTARHDSRRIDRQLVGRAARHGERGSFEFLTALDDTLLDEHGRGLCYAAVRACASVLGAWAAPLVRTVGPLLLDMAQARASREHRLVRQQLLQVDEWLNDTLAFSGRPE